MRVVGSDQNAGKLSEQSLLAALPALLVVRANSLMSSVLSIAKPLSKSIARKTPMLFGLTMLRGSVNSAERKLLLKAERLDRKASAGSSSRLKSVSNVLRLVQRSLASSMQENTLNDLANTTSRTAKSGMPEQERGLRFSNKLILRNIVPKPQRQGATGALAAKNLLASTKQQTSNFSGLRKGAIAFSVSSLSFVGNSTSIITSRLHAAVQTTEAIFAFCTRNVILRNLRETHTNTLKITACFAGDCGMQGAFR